jgi:hypothetical protein
MKVGIILHRFQDTNTFIVDVGCGQVRYFVSKVQYNIGDYVLYNEIFLEEESTQDEFNTTGEELHNSVEIKRANSKSNIIEEVCGFSECDYRGNISDFERQTFHETSIVIARRDLFVYWEVYEKEGEIYHSAMQTFDNVSNSLLFLTYAKQRYSLPNENDFLKAFTEAKKQVEEYNIPKMIEELKVEFHTSCFTRRGSDNVLITRKKIECNISEHYAFHIDSYLDNFLPKYSILKSLAITSAMKDLLKS